MEYSNRMESCAVTSGSSIDWLLTQQTGSIKLGLYPNLMHGSVCGGWEALHWKTLYTPVSKSYTACYLSLCLSELYFDPAWSSAVKYLLLLKLLAVSTPLPPSAYLRRIAELWNYVDTYCGWSYDAIMRFTISLPSSAGFADLYCSVYFPNIWTICSIGRLFDWYLLLHYPQPCLLNLIVSNIFVTSNCPYVWVCCAGKNKPELIFWLWLYALALFCNW